MLFARGKGGALGSLRTVLSRTFPTPVFHPKLQQCQHQGKRKAEETVSSPRIKFLFSALAVKQFSLNSEN